MRVEPVAQAGSSKPAARQAVSQSAAIAQRAAVWILVLIGGGLLWSYWSTIVELVVFWQRNQDYSVGMLIPPTAAYLAWRDRAMLSSDRWRPTWWGVVFFALIELGRLTGVFLGVGSAERYALVGAIAASWLAIAGWRMLWHTKWLLLFMILMIPLPSRVHEEIALPLQSLATASAVVGLELLGFFVVREGNVLQLEGGHAVAVAEACSGLRMLTAFIFVAAVLAFLVKRPAWHKAVLVGASIPIAVMCNSVRVIATSLVIYYSSSHAVTETFHDGAGLAMMPVAIAICVGLLQFLAFLQGAEKVKAGARP